MYTRVSSLRRVGALSIALLLPRAFALLRSVVAPLMLQSSVGKPDAAYFSAALTAAEKNSSIRLGGGRGSVT